MAENLINLAVPGLGSALALTGTLLGALYAKYNQLKEGKELCASLHKRLHDFAFELEKIAPVTLQAEDLLPRLLDLIKEFFATVTSYADESNFVKRVKKANKFADKVKVYNERLDSLISMISVKQTVVLLEWRSQYEQDSRAMENQLSQIENITREIWKAIKQLPSIEDIVLVLKRDLLDSQCLTQSSDNQDPENTPQALDPLKNRIIDVAENKFIHKKLANPPEWLIDDDEVTLADKPIDSEGMSQIFVGEWQGAQVAVKKFYVVGESPVFEKHFTVWRTLLHPHVAQLFGAGSTSGAPFFVYEYTSRQSLDRCWDQLSQKELWQMLHQAALGLLYLHKKHIVHGNLSCSKLLVTSQGDIKLFGFGASYVRKDNKSNSVKPKMRDEFKAPECIGIDKNGMECGIYHSPSFKSDVYSFGLTIMEAIAKEDPFVDMYKPGVILAAKQRQQLPRPQHLSNEAWDLVQRMCMCDPAKRVSLEHVAGQLQQFAQ